MALEVRESLSLLLFCLYRKHGLGKLGRYAGSFQ